MKEEQIRQAPDHTDCSAGNSLVAGSQASLDHIHRAAELMCGGGLRVDCSQHEEQSAREKSQRETQEQDSKSGTVMSNKLTTVGEA